MATALFHGAGIVSGLAPALKTAIKWSFITLFAIVLLIVLLIGAVLMALRSDTGTAWVLEQIPGLETTGASGSVIGQWHADHLSWQGYGVELDVDTPRIHWKPACLLRLRFCLENLEAGSLDVVMQPSEGEGSGRSAIELPDVALPVNVDIRSVDLGPFHYNGTLVWDQLLLEAGGGGSDFEVHQFNLTREEVALALDGRLETRGDWPLAVNLDLTLPPPSGDSWRIQGDILGNLRDLRASLVSSGYLDATLEAEAAPLDPALPVSVEFRSDSFLAVDTLPQTLTLTDWTLTGRGNMVNGYRIDTRARLPAEPGPIEMTVSGRVTQEEATDLQVQLVGPAASGDGLAEFSAEGDVSWKDELNAEAQIRMGAFPWYSLLPEQQPLPVTIESLEASGRFSGNQYQASLDVDASGPMGDSTLVTQVDGDLESVRLTDLTMTTGAGQLHGEAEVGFADLLQWQADLTLQGFNPGYWVPQAEASINGTVTSQGQLTQSGEPDFTASWELDGQWQDAPLSSRGDLEAESGQWRIPEILASIGDNQLAASGELQNPTGDAGTLSVEGTLALPDPGIVVPGLKGDIEGTVSLTGPIRMPHGNLDLRATEMAWQDQLSLEELKLTATLDNSQSLDAQLAVRDLQAGGETVDSVQADLGGTLQNHRLTLSVRQQTVNVDAALEGAWQTDNGGEWRGQLVSGDVALVGPDQTWQLEEPAAIEYVSQTLTVGAHCWRWQDSTLCAGEQTLFPDTSLNMEISQFPTSALAPLMPADLSWNAMINGKLNVQLEEDGPQGNVQVNAGPGSFLVSMGEQQQTLDYQSLDLTLDMVPQKADVTLLFDGQDIGELSVDLSVDPNAPDRPITGTYTLEGFDLAVLGALLDMEDMGGTIAGSGRLEGPLLAPQVYGQVALTDGRLVDEQVPIPLEDLNLQVNFNGSRADLDGSWQSNGTGSGEIGGSVVWSGEPRLTITLKGERLPLHYEPYADLEVSPDLEVNYSAGELTVAGRVAIPKGSIEVRELPPQAVAVSRDEVIVGDEAETGSSMALNMDVTVVVGEDEVTFNGFGVSGNLEGELQIGNEMDTRGALQLVDGEYEAFGQELELRRARLVFLGPVSEPYLDIEAIREVDDVLVGVRLSGPAKEPETEIFSEPSMSQNEALSYLLLGRPLESQGDQNQVSRMALALGLNRASGITRGIGETFGIQDLTLEAEGSGDDSAVVASGYLTEDLSIRYGVGLFEPVTTVALRYDLGRYFYIEAASGLASSLDIFYNRDF